MSFKQYQIEFNPDGSVLRVQEMPTETPKKRVIFIRETNATKAEARAKALFSLAK